MQIISKLAHAKRRMRYLAVTLSVGVPLFSVGCSQHVKPVLPPSCAAPTALSCGAWATSPNFQPLLATLEPKLTLGEMDATACENISGAISIVSTTPRPQPPISPPIAFNTPLVCGNTNLGICVCTGVITAPPPFTNYLVLGDYSLSLTCTDPESGLASVYASTGEC